MELLSTIFQYFLDLGAAVFVPIIMIVAGLCVKMKLKDAISAGITLGVAFVGMNLVVGFMKDAITPVATGMLNSTGLQLDIVDGGWTTMATISWSWPYAFAIFPLQIGINVLMLIFNKTKTFNADLWNVWGKIFIAVIVISLTNNIWIALAIASLQIILELRSGDLHQKTIQSMTGIPGVTCTHRTLFFGCILYPFDCLLKKIPALNKPINIETLRDKIGIFAENHVLGFILGCIFGVIAGYDVGGILNLGIKCACALMLFPMVSKLFMQSLAPISDAVSEFMQKKFAGRELYVGLDWPFMGGINELWIAIIFIIPMIFIDALILPGNNMLPFAGIINFSLAIPALLVTRGNLPRMFILCLIGAPVFLWVGTAIAPYMSELARATGAIELGVNELISNSCINAPVFTYGFGQMFKALTGDFVPLIVAGGWTACWVFYSRYLKKETARLEAEEKAENE